MYDNNDTSGREGREALRRDHVGWVERFLVGCETESKAVCRGAQPEKKKSQVLFQYVFMCVILDAAATWRGGAGGAVLLRESCGCEVGQKHFFYFSFALMYSATRSCYFFRLRSCYFFLMMRQKLYSLGEDINIYSCTRTGNIAEFI